MDQQPQGNGAVEHHAAGIIGVGVGGVYALYHLCGMGFSVRAYAGGGVGDTWWWNRSPGARDGGHGGLGSPFSYDTFSEELVRAWDWAEPQPCLASGLAYLGYVAVWLDPRRNIPLETGVRHPWYDEAAQRWMLGTNTGERISAQFPICAVGILSAAHTPDLPGLEDFAGECSHPGHWPPGPISCGGKRIGVIRPGSSGRQAIPKIAREAAHLTVFQRTPQYSILARNRPLDSEVMRQVRETWAVSRATLNASPLGAPIEVSERSACEATFEQRQALYEEPWQKGGVPILFGRSADLLPPKEANRTLASLERGKIRESVRDPATAEKLMSASSLSASSLGIKRQLLDPGSSAAFTRDTGALVALRQDPIQESIPAGVRTAKGAPPLDRFVLATGFDAISGALLRLNPKGRGGVSLEEKWRPRFDPHLGVATPDFPNFFLRHGPGPPSGRDNLPLGAEGETEWSDDGGCSLREQGLGVLEPPSDAEQRWDREGVAFANEPLYPLTDSWDTGAKIPGKPCQFYVSLDGPARGDEGFVSEEERHVGTAASLSSFS